MLGLALHVTVSLGGEMQESWLRFSDRCSLLRGVETEIDTTPYSIDEIRRHTAEYELNRISKHDLGSDFFAYYKARFLRLNGEAEEAIPVLAKLVSSPSVGPEAIYDLTLIHEDLPQGLYSECNRVLARMVPLRSRPIGMELRPPDFMNEREILARIADLFLDMGMCAEASSAHREAAYNRGGYNQDEAAPSWLMAAIVEHRQGDDTQSANNLAKALVFGDPSVFERASEFLKTLRAGKEVQRVEATPTADKLKEIADLYAEMNLHPRAVALLEKHRAVIGQEAEQLITRYKQEWENLYENYRKGFPEDKPCTLFGEGVTLKDKWVNISVPPLCSEESLKAASKVVSRYLVNFVAELGLPPENEGNPVAALEHRCLLVRKLQRQMQKSLEDVTAMDQARQVGAESLQKFGAIHIPKDALGGAFFAYYRARLLLLSGAQQDAVDVLLPLLDTDFAIEAFDELCEVGELSLPKGADGASRYEQMLARVLPLSSTARWIDDRQSGLLPDRKNRPRFFFSFNHERDFQIAELFEDMKMNEAAIIARKEALYTIGGGPVTRVLPHEFTGRLSFDSFEFDRGAPVWLRIASDELRLGNLDAMANALARVIVFSVDDDMADDDELTMEARDLASEAQKADPKKATAVPDPRKLREIVNLYQERNVHPHALALLRRYRDVFGAREPDELRKSVEQNWLKLLDRYYAGAEKRILFGQDIARPEDALKVVVPPMCRKEVMQDAAKEFRKLLKK